MAHMTKAVVCAGLMLIQSWIGQAHAAEEKPILAIVPKVAELGEDWTTNVVAYLLDPKSQPSEIDYQRDAESSPALFVQREVMKTNGRTGCALVLYGCGDLIENSGLHRVFIQRWENRRLLHNQWVRWKMDPNRVVRTTPDIGEDYFWTQEWWRQTLVRQNFIFRRGLFHVVIETGAEINPERITRLAEVLDAKIRGRPVPKPVAVGNREPEGR
jgi:hypothetical protein